MNINLDDDDAAQQQPEQRAEGKDLDLDDGAEINVELDDGKGGKKNVALDDIQIKFDEAPRGSDAPLGGGPTKEAGDFSGGQGG